MEGVQPWMPESRGRLDPCPASVGVSPGAMPWWHWGPASVLQASCNACPGEGGLAFCIPHHGPTS